jgi:hypothetical protein
MIQDNTKAKFHLSNGLRLNFDNYIILEDMFPVWTKKWFRIALHKKIKWRISLKRFGLLGRNISYSFSKGYLINSRREL